MQHGPLNIFTQVMSLSFSLYLLYSWFLVIICRFLIKLKDVIVSCICHCHCHYHVCSSFPPASVTSVLYDVLAYGYGVPLDRSHSHSVFYFVPQEYRLIRRPPELGTRPNWARKVREMILFSVLCTVYCGRGCMSLRV